MKISTRTGDDGTTSLYSGERVPKTHPRVAACGAVDEVNSLLGAARAARPQPEVEELLEAVQRQLFQAGSDLATAGERPPAERVSGAEIGWLEAQIDRMEEALPALRNFILPGGTPAAAQIHVARAVARRCERLAHEVEGCREEVAAYLNRLSDFLFVLARRENQLAGVADAEWRP